MRVLAILSMMIMGIGLTASASPIDLPKVLVKPEVAAARVAACGFRDVRARFDDTLQEDVVEVLNVSSASPEQLKCAALASLDTVYYVVFPGPVEQAYEALYWRMSGERDKASATAWLERRGLLSRLPTYEPKRTDEVTFARTLETLCGPKAAGTLLPMHGMATFTPEALGTFGKAGFTKGKLDDETLWCLINAAEVSGYPLGFIGNEYTATPNK